MLRRLIREDIEIVTCLGAERAQIRADPGQIEQVIINLAINARDAMPHPRAPIHDAPWAAARPSKVERAAQDLNELARRLQGVVAASGNHHPAATRSG